MPRSRAVSPSPHRSWASASRAPAHAPRVWATSSTLVLQHLHGNAARCPSPGTLMDHARQREAAGAFMCLHQLVAIILDSGDFLWRELHSLKECLDRVPAPNDGGLVLWNEERTLDARHAIDAGVPLGVAAQALVPQDVVDPYVAVRVGG